MATTALRDLDGVRSALTTCLDNDMAFNAVNTRIVLRTGVNLKAIRPDQRTNETLIAKVVDTIAEMGYRL